MGALATPIFYALDELDRHMFEAVATIKALEFVTDLGFCHVEIERDSLVIICKLCSTGLDLSTVGVVLENVKGLCSRFLSCKFMHTFREGNMVAHGLAKLGLDLQEYFVWVEDYPPYVHTMLCDDVIQLVT
ncbi:hypothetical protein PTKIN_Ptkin12aG0121600 [Pterospermum kingtungense]